MGWFCHRVLGLKGSIAKSKLEKKKKNEADLASCNYIF